MIGDHFDRDDQTHGKRPNTGIAAFAGRLFGEIAVGFTALHRIQFSAPWTARNPH